MTGNFSMYGVRVEHLAVMCLTVCNPYRCTTRECLAFHKNRRLILLKSRSKLATMARFNIPQMRQENLYHLQDFANLVKCTNVQSMSYLLLYIHVYSKCIPTCVLHPGKTNKSHQVLFDGLCQCLIHSCATFDDHG